MVQYEEKFIIINTKHLRQIPEKLQESFMTQLLLIKDYIPKHKYYACNQDEPYAGKIIKIILEGENEKREEITKMIIENTHSF